MAIDTVNLTEEDRDALYDACVGILNRKSLGDEKLFDDMIKSVWDAAGTALINHELSKPTPINEFLNKRLRFLDNAVKNSLLVRMQVGTVGMVILPIDVWKDGDRIKLDYRVLNQPLIKTEFIDHLPPGAFTPYPEFY